MAVETAPIRATPPTLYHYQPYNPEFLADLLTRQRIHCASPAKLNDPWDCQPWYNRKSMEDPDNLAKYIDWLNEFQPDQTPARRSAIEQHLNDTERLSAAIDELSKGIQQEVARRRIYCLTPHPDSILMWSHYAKDHSGVCLEFRTDDPLFMGARKVEYLLEYPVFLPWEMGPGQASTVLLTKSIDWSYEDEFRLIGIPKAPQYPPIQLDGDYLALPDGALTAIIIGCRADHDKAVNFFRCYAPNLPLKKAVQSRDQYRLEIVG